ncbi:MAG TPA: hypothetical protein VGE72_02810 [Azospirillum sp.]
MTVGGSARPHAADGRRVTGWVHRVWGLGLWILCNAAVAALSVEPSPMVPADPLWLLPSVVIFTWAIFTWAIFTWAIFTWAVYRVARLVRPDAPWRIAQYVLVLAIPAAAADVLRGQGEVMVIAVMLHAAVDLAWRRWARGGLLAAMVVTVLAVDHLDFAPAYTAMTAVRAATALCTLGAAFLAYRRLDGRTATLVALMLAVSWLALFGPRGWEGPFVGVAVLAALTLFAERRRRPQAALPVLLGALAVGLGTPVHGAWAHRPVLVLLLYVYIAAVLAQRRTLVDPEPEPARPGDWRPDRVAIVLCAAVPALYAVAWMPTEVSLRQWLSSFEVVDYLLLVVALNLIGVALVVATGPLWAWMRGRTTRPTLED